MEQDQLKALKREIKQVFDKIGADFDTYNTSRDSLEKQRILQATESSMKWADGSVRSFEIQLKMFSVSSADGKSGFEEDLEMLKNDLQGSRTKLY